MRLQLAASQVAHSQLKINGSQLADRKADMTSGRLFFVFLLFIPTLTISVVFAQEKSTSNSAEDKPPGIELTIDYGDGAQKRFPQVPWKRGMTVLDALTWAQKHPHGIELKYRGKNALAVVGQIDDLKNGGSNGKNWIFYVDAKLAERSCGAIKIQPRQKILWRFEVYR